MSKTRAVQGSPRFQDEAVHASRRLWPQAVTSIKKINFKPKHLLNTSLQSITIYERRKKDTPSYTRPHLFRMDLLYILTRPKVQLGLVIRNCLMAQLVCYSQNSTMKEHLTTIVPNMMAFGAVFSGYSNQAVADVYSILLAGVAMALAHRSPMTITLPDRVKTSVCTLNTQLHHGPGQNVT